MRTNPDKTYIRTSIIGNVYWIILTLKISVQWPGLIKSLIISRVRLKSHTTSLYQFKGIRLSQLRRLFYFDNYLLFALLVFVHVLWWKLNWIVDELNWTIILNHISVDNVASRCCWLLLSKRKYLQKRNICLYFTNAWKTCYPQVKSIWL